MLEDEQQHQQAVIEPEGAATTQPETSENPEQAPEETIDWKAQSRKHEDRAKRLAAQVDALRVRAERADTELAQLRADLAEKDRLILVAEVAREKGVPADRVRGNTREEMEADAADLARLLAATPVAAAGGAGYVPAAGTGNPDTAVNDVEAARARARNYLGIKTD